MHKVTFFPTGNADACFIEIANGRRIMFDFADQKNRDDNDDKRCDLEAELRKRLGSTKKVDVLAISHLDADHFQRTSDVFWLEHAAKYQSDDRIKINTLWVPVAAIVEEGITDEGRILRSEARFRLEQGTGIRVFGRATLLDSWLRDRGINPADRSKLITDAGKVAPDFSLAADGVEFFVHSPFASRDEDGNLVDRNGSALFMQAKFEVGGSHTRLILSADCPYEPLEAIIAATKKHGNEERLEWDINNIPHHCSYLSLSDEKGDDETEPGEEIDWLYSTQGASRSFLVSTSKPIPTGGEDKQPPHRQAANYYRRIAREHGGEFRITMEHPSAGSPKPMEFEIDRFGARLLKPVATPAVAAVSSRPRAGSR
jgi:hypothetical protein